MIPRKLFATFVQLLALGSPAHADWPADPNDNVPVFFAPNDYDTDPQVATDSLGGALIAYQAQGGPGGYPFNIAVKHLKGNGSLDPLWPAMGCVLYTNTFQGNFRPRIKEDLVGGAFLLYHQPDPPVTRIQHVLWNGQLDSAWPLDGVWVSPSVSEHVLTADGFGGAFIAWAESRNGVDTDVFVQHVLENGVKSPLWPDSGLMVANGPNNQSDPQITGDGTGGAYVTWTHREPGMEAIFAHHLLSDGQSASGWPTGGTAVCTVGGTADISLVSDGFAGAIVAWADRRSGDADIYVHRLTPNAGTDSSWPADGQALCTEQNDQTSACATADGNGGAVVAWNDYRSSTVPMVFAQHVLPSGAVDLQWPLGGRALSGPTQAQSIPRIAIDGSGGAIVTWQRYDPPESGMDIYAQRVRATGGLDYHWPTIGRAISTAPAWKTKPRIVADGRGGAVIAWMDMRNGNIGVYAQGVDSSGYLGPAAVTVDHTMSTGMTLCAFPNPIGDCQIEVEFSLSCVSEPSLSLLDIGGRVVAVESLGSRHAGPHRFRLRTSRDLSPGVYFLQLRSGSEALQTRVVKLDRSR